MEAESAETVVKVFSILSYVSAGLCILGGLAFLAGGAIVGSVMQGVESDIPSELVGGVLMVLGVLAFIFAVLEIFIGVGLWRHRNWARIVTVVFAWISVPFALLAMLGSPFTSILTLILSAIEIWLFQFEPAVKGLFTSAAP